jgi:hypothetical protein
MWQPIIDIEHRRFAVLCHSDVQIWALIAAETWIDVMTVETRFDHGVRVCGPCGAGQCDHTQVSYRRLPRPVR